MNWIESIRIANWNALLHQLIIGGDRQQCTDCEHTTAAVCAGQQTAFSSRHRHSVRTAVQLQRPDHAHRNRHVANHVLTTAAVHLQTTDVPTYLFMYVQCFDTVGWGRASDLQKIEWRGVGEVICLQRDAHCLHMVQLMLLSSHNPITSLNPDWFYLSSTGQHRQSWKRGC